MMRYDFFCTACLSAIELTLSFKDVGKPQSCPICGAASMKRKYVAPQIIWQGRALLKQDGIDDNYVFPKMESVRREDRTYRGVNFNEQAGLEK